MTFAGPILYLWTECVSCLGLPVSIRPFLVLVLAAFALAGCARAPAPTPLPPPPPLDAKAACLQDLTSHNVVYQALDTYGNAKQGCEVDNPVKVSATNIPWNKPSVVSCSLARTISQFEAEVLQPLAQSNFNQPVVRIHQMGTYACRLRNNNSTKVAMATGNTKNLRMSEHSTGQAIDIGAVELADGTLISVKKDWRGAGQKSTFLHQLARASCSVFSVVLTPNYDSFHQDHLHLDVGRYSLCGY